MLFYYETTGQEEVSYNTSPYVHLKTWNNLYSIETKRKRYNDSMPSETMTNLKPL